MQLVPGLFLSRRNAVKMALNRACASYFQRAFTNSRTKTWRAVRQYLIASEKAAPGTSAASHPNPDWTDRLNKFFASVGGDVAHSLAAVDGGEPLPPRPPRVCGDMFSPGPATLPELSAALQLLLFQRPRRYHCRNVEYDVCCGGTPSPPYN